MRKFYNYSQFEFSFVRGRELQIRLVELVKEGYHHALGLYKIMLDDQKQRYLFYKCDFKDSWDKIKSGAKIEIRLKEQIDNVVIL